jgi:lipopolysaccharide/colanic/teichoic acid biosynthesis glycosyltransferase
VPPGLSGVGSIIFRDEERYLDAQTDPHAFYRDVIIPYKAQLEQWYVRNRSLRMYFEVIFLTVWVILFPSSDLPRRVWPSLPKAPGALRS